MIASIYTIDGTRSQRPASQSTQTPTLGHAPAGTIKGRHDQQRKTLRYRQAALTPNIIRYQGPQKRDQCHRKRALHQENLNHNAQAAARQEIISATSTT